MADYRQRRSPRIAVRVPIRIFGKDSKGINFFLDSSTVVVNRHGARVRLSEDLDPVGDIFILCQATDEGERFRIVTPNAPSPPHKNLKGVECRNPEKNIWGIEFPEVTAEDLQFVQVLLECPQCASVVNAMISESEVEVALADGGFQRECSVCGFSGLWNEKPYLPS